MEEFRDSRLDFVSFYFNIVPKKKKKKVLKVLQRI